MNNDLRKLKRSDLIDIIYAYQKKTQELENENKALKAKLRDKTIRIQNAGSIADAALALNDVFQAAQAAADQYLQNIRLMNSHETVLSSDKVPK